jgi:DNA-binding XRE family transcriptional regulator
MQYRNIIQSTFITLRKKRSREQVSRHLLVDKSTIYKWEKGLTQPLWSQLTKYIKLNKIQISRKINQRLGVTNYLDGKQLLAHFVANEGIDNVAHIAKVTKQTINNNIRRSDPKVELIFSLWSHFSPHSFLIFLDLLIGIDNLNELHELSRNWNFEASISKKHPYFAGVIHIIERKLGKEESIHKISQCFDITKTEATCFIEDLLRVNFIGESKDKYLLNSKHIFDASKDFDLTKSLHQYWTKRSLDRFTKECFDSGESKYGYLIMSLSEEGLQKVNSEYARFYSSLRKIALEDKKRLVSTHSLTVQFTKI